MRFGCQENFTRPPFGEMSLTARQVGHSKWELQLLRFGVTILLKLLANSLFSLVAFPPTSADRPIEKFFNNNSCVSADNGNKDAGNAN